MIGEQPSGISPFLHQIFARISDREKAVMKAKKEHENAESGATTHDSWTCDKKKKKAWIEEIAY